MLWGGGKAGLIPGLARYEDLTTAIHEITHGEMLPSKPRTDDAYIEKFFQKHPLISPIELREAFELKDDTAVKGFIRKWIAPGKLECFKVHHGWYIRRLPQAAPEKE